jgi:hypothetical protein
MIGGRRVWSLAAVAISAAASLASACSEAALQAPCATPCPSDQVCQHIVNCDDSGTSCFSTVCSPKCAVDSECPSGHSCSPVEGVCSPYCDPTTCPAGTACSGLTGNCDTGQDCSTVTCAQGTFCDPASVQCYSVSGACNPAACRDATALGIESIEISCTNMECRISRTPNVGPSDLTAPVAISIGTPTPGLELPPSSDFAIQWPPRPNPVLLTISLQSPASSADLVVGPTWGASADAGTAMIMWSQGHQVTDGGNWLSSAGNIPTEVPLFLFLEEFTPGGLIAVSSVIPFSVGQAWLVEGQACEDTDEDSLDPRCGGPEVADICYEGTCRRLCESRLDCPEALGGCGLPIDNGARLCGVN